MNTHSDGDSQISREAFEWLVELEDTDTDPLSRYRDVDARKQAFVQWFLRSERHQEAFIEAVTISGISRLFDQQHRVDISALLSSPEHNIVRFRADLFGLASDNRHLASPNADPRGATISKRMQW